MKLALQFGHGMLELSKELIEEWGEGTVILSPRNVAQARQVTFAEKIIKVGGSVLFDPQFYVPHKKHKNLTKYDFWPSGYDVATFWSGKALPKYVKALFEYNAALGTDVVILPGLYSDTVTDAWLENQKRAIAAAREIDSSRPIYTTVALGPEAVHTDSQIHEFLDDAADWDVDGVYLCLRHPQEDYIVREDPKWIANVLDIAASFRLRDRYVLLGYSHHQQLIAACAAVNEIAAGTWMNVRHFLPDVFWTTEEQEGGSHNVWYYAPSALTEYSRNVLDIAHGLGVLNSLQVPADISSPGAGVLFTAAQPSVSGFEQRDAFIHYLVCLRAQVHAAIADTFDATVARHQDLLAQAQRLLDPLRKQAIKGQDRDFHGALDPNRGALAMLQASRGPALRRAWPKIAKA